MVHEDIIVKIAGKLPEIKAVEASLENISNQLYAIRTAAFCIMHNGYMDIDRHDKLIADIDLYRKTVYDLKNSCKPLIRWLTPRPNTKLLPARTPLTDADIDAYNVAVRVANLDGCGDIIQAVSASLKSEHLIAE